ncbi:DNA (cytosine-5-)-methyltransferase [bacterium]|nr:DNA (cytosine-5-)-methyltransferase [bacterium]|tara:strand:+ start:1188 stop:2285 length:1098 start_codon:yes stop_codon:yes gene_type:complete
MQKLRGISLFSGVGGMDIAAHKSGVDIVYANEIDPVIGKALSKNFPGTEVIIDDINNVDSFPEAEIVFGGYPCQSFSMGGKRDPKKDPRTLLYLQFARVLNQVNPLFFIAENVSGLSKIKNGSFLSEQLKVFGKSGKSGYNVTYKVVNAQDYGVPQSRKRIFLVGVRKDLDFEFVFPEETHGKVTKKTSNLLPYTSHGEVIKDLPLWPEGEFYERPNEEGNFSWYFMSRNRKADWDKPAYTVVANWRHITLHPACPKMKLTWSDLENGWKQRWDFSDEYEHLEKDSTRQILEKPRRLSWREAARIQTFPDNFHFEGNTEQKFTQIGNAVPPMLAQVMFSHLINTYGINSKTPLVTAKNIRQNKLP